MAASRKPFISAFCVAFPMFFLIWLGGLVTTQDAGMAVPDWPGTYGYNMFAYPLSAWLYGPIDLCVEHGHRLLASFVGLLSIFFCIVTSLYERRRWVRWMAVGLLLCIIAQGILGGARVLMDARTLAMIHGCFAPLVFAFACSAVLVTSRCWHEPIIGKAEQPKLPEDRRELPTPPDGLRRSASSVSGIESGHSTNSRLQLLLQVQTVATVLQLFIGAQLRHTQPATPPAAFMGLVHTHLTLAFVVLGFILLTTWMCEARFRRMESRTATYIRRFARLLLVLVAVQVSLGFGTWIVNYALPWGDSLSLLAEYTIAVKGYWESWVTTLHQACGSLIIAFSLLSTLLVFRHRRLSAESLARGEA